MRMEMPTQTTFPKAARYVATELARELTAGISAPLPRSRTAKGAEDLGVVMRGDKVCVHPRFRS